MAKRHTFIDLRRDAGLSQAKLAVRVGVHPNTIKNIENGATTSAEVAQQLVLILDCEVSDLFPIQKAG